MQWNVAHQFIVFTEWIVKAVTAYTQHKIKANVKNDLSIAIAGTSLQIET